MISTVITGHAKSEFALKFTLIPAQSLTAQHFAAWDAIQRADPNLASPFFRPGFTLALAEVRPDIEVAILEQDDAVVGFFPFHRRRENVGLPVGGVISDYHGLVLQASVQLSVRELLRHCRLSAWHFDHLPAAQPAFSRHHWRQTCSPYIDTSGGFEAYRANRSAAGSKIISRTLQKQRKLQREVGPIRVEVMTREPRVLETLMQWKSDQYRKSGVFDPFLSKSTRELFQNLLLRSDPAFCGVMSALYVNEQLAAVFYFLRSHRTAHAWSTAYRQDLARYSPGSQLLLSTIQSASTLGIDRIDLGKGDERYKQSFMSGAVPLTEGSVDLRRGTRTLRHLWYCTRQWVRGSSLRRPLTGPWRWIKRELYRAQFP